MRRKFKTVRVKGWKVTAFAASAEAPWCMDYKDFVFLTEIPEELLPSDYRPVSWQEIGELIGKPINSFYDFADEVNYGSLKDADYTGDNTYNYGWWGPTVDYKKVRINEKTTIVIIGLHRGGDVRGNYEWFPFIVNRDYDDVHPWVDIFGDIDLFYLFEKDGIEVVATAIDDEGLHFEIYPEEFRSEIEPLISEAYEQQSHHCGIETNRLNSQHLKRQAAAIAPLWD